MKDIFYMNLKQNVSNNEVDLVLNHNNLVDVEDIKLIRT